MGISTERIEEFLDNLADNDTWRQNLIDDPIAVLQDYDVDTSEVTVPDEVVLPSKEHVRDNRDAYREHIFPAGEYSIYGPIFTLPTGN